MATVKITVTLDKQQVNAIRKLVAEGHAANVSAFLKSAVQASLGDAQGWRETMDQALAETGGPLTKKERAWARSVLSGKAGRVVRKNKAKAA